MIKQYLKRLIQNHLGRYLFPFLKLFWTPHRNLRKSLLFTGKVKITVSPKVHFLLINRNFYTETDFFWLGFERYEWELQTRKLWIKLSKVSDTILDIGANTGFYSMLAKRINPECHIHAFEPQPNIYEVLVENKKINYFEINTYPLAISNSFGEYPFYNYGTDTFSKLNTTAGSLNESWNVRRDAAQSSIIVKTSTLDRVIEEKEISKVDLIKIDVESFEPEVLEGYVENISSHRPIFIMEIQKTSYGKRIEDQFRNMEYKFFHIDEKEGLNSCLELGNHVEFKNYCLCPKEKLHFVLA